MASGYTRPNEKVMQHVNKSYAFADGGRVMTPGLTSEEHDRNQINYQQWMKLQNAIRQQKKGK